MATSEKNLRICPNGHRYYKSSDCPVCPVCETEGAPADGFLSTLSAPARRALESLGISTIKELSKYTQADIMKLHGMGPASLPNLLAALKNGKLSFKK